MSPYFSEKDYLEANPDVVHYVREGTFQSGWHHYTEVGLREGRRLRRAARPLERQLFYCHIPKTGGTSIRLALAAQCSPFEIVPDAFMLERNNEKYPDPGDIVSVVKAQRQAIKLFYGHYPLSMQKLVPGFYTATVLRNPIERAISHIRHVIAEGQISEAEALEKLERGEYFLADNLQTRFLAREWNRVYKPECTEADLIEARSTLSLVSVVGISEDMIRFAERLGDILNVSIKVGRENSSAGKRPALSKKQFDTIRQNNLLDIELYEHARLCTMTDIARIEDTD